MLKNIDTTDREFIFSQFSDDKVNRYLFDAEPLTDIQGADEIIGFYTQPEPRLQHRWIIIRESDGDKMGTCGFHCWNMKDGVVDVGYDLKEKYWGNGYMQEARYDLVLSTYSLHHFDHEEKLKLYKRIYASIKKGGSFINGDYTVKDIEKEKYYMEENIRLRREQGKEKGFYHYDIPLTVETEKELLKQAGFERINIHKQWDNTTIFVCYKDN